MAGISLEATRRIRGPHVASFLVNQESEASLPGERLSLGDMGRSRESTVPRDRACTLGPQ